MPEEVSSYPPVEPSSFDLIVVGTGLPESIIASAASAAGKTVLQLDANQFYGYHYTSLTLDGLVSFLQCESSSPCQPSQVSDEYVSVPIVNRSLYSEVEIKSYSSEPMERSGKFNIDLGGPRVFLCSDSMTDLVIKTGVNNYMEFKSVEASFVSDGNGKLVNVPDSRSAIFRDRSLSLTEKNQLMKFFKLVQGHFDNGSEENKIPKNDLEKPFVEFLSRMELSQKLKWIILYAIVQANYDQDRFEVCKDIIDTRSGISHLALYSSSVGRFPNANGAMLYPMYGHIELPQAFCRRAAVKGCICGLGMPIVAVLMDKDAGTYKGVKLASGQDIFSPRLILPPSLSISSVLSHAAAHEPSCKDAKAKVARGICITESSIKVETANCLVCFPPRSLYPEQIVSVRVLQLSSNMAVCPSGMFVSYLSAICDQAEEGKKLLNAAINTLFLPSTSRNFEKNEAGVLSDHTEEKTRLLWSALYIQELTAFNDFSDSISHTMMPDEHLDYSNLLNATEKLFREIYPNEEFVSSTTFPDEPMDDGSSELDP